jgi:Protein of unknown function (DUF2510)
MSGPAGWYPQPDGRQRYWDGELWTENFAPGVPAVTTSGVIGGKSFQRFGGRANVFGWGGLVLTVLLGAVSSGFSGALVMLGLFVLVVGVVALARGRVGWARLGSRVAGGAALGVALVLMTVGAVAAPPSKPSDTASVAVQTSAAAGSDSPTPSSSTLTSAAVSSPPTTAPPKVTAKASPIQTHTAGGITVNAAGAVLPNSARTPGAVNPSVSQANIGRTICVSGWTATIRPDSSYTTELKVQQLASGYTYKGDTAKGNYEGRPPHLPGDRRCSRRRDQPVARALQQPRGGQGQGRCREQAAQPGLRPRHQHGNGPAGHRYQLVGRVPDLCGGSRPEQPELTSTGAARPCTRSGSGSGSAW